MVADLLACERLGDLGELRSFRRDGPPAHFAFEILQDADGRAWTLRVPVARKSALLAVLRDGRRRLENGLPLAFDAAGSALIASRSLAADDELAAVVLQQAGELVFSLWRRERAGEDWSWTLDALFVPMKLALPLCALIERALDGGAAG